MALTQEDIKAVKRLIDERLDLSDQIMNDCFEDMYGRLDSIEARLDAVDIRLDDIENDLRRFPDRTAA